MQVWPEPVAYTYVARSPADPGVLVCGQPNRDRIATRPAAWY
ncbi:hypothetical protein ACF1E9_31220 [Streptomyces roseolus]